MTEKTIEDVYKEYNDDVKWLREHVPPDDIYDFAQQMILIAKYVAGTLNAHTELDELMKNDKQLFLYLSNLQSLDGMKESKFKGIISVNFKVQKN